MPIIKTTHLTKLFGELKAVDDLSFSVDEGDVYGFLGQNGAGKSTTIRMLLTLITTTSGTIELLGKDLRRNRKAILRQVGAVIERPDLYRYLSGYENLSLFATMSGIRAGHRLLMEQLDRVGLAERATTRVHAYSQGMKQRLGIAVALIHNPELVILDEPTNGLDPQGIADMRNLILFLSRQLKKTILLSSHLLSEIEQVASKILIIDNGRKITEGSAAELLNPATTLVEVSVTDISDALQKLEHTSWRQHLTKTDAGSMVLRVHRNQVPALNRDLVNMNISVTGLKPRHSLEDYFLSITGTGRHVAAFTD
jgi:ABC-type multidrug transport system ATPase subunit